METQDHSLDSDTNYLLRLEQEVQLSEVLAFPIYKMGEVLILKGAGLLCKCHRWMFTNHLPSSGCTAWALKSLTETISVGSFLHPRTLEDAIHSNINVEGY